jgi:hypothetical protein
MGHARKERVLLFGTDQRITSGPAAKRPHSKAEYMTAPERFADSQIPLAPRAPSIHDPYSHAESKKTQKFAFRSTLRPNQISFSHSQDPKPSCAGERFRTAPYPPARARPLADKNMQHHRMPGMCSPFRSLKSFNATVTPESSRSHAHLGSVGRSLISTPLSERKAAPSMLDRSVHSTDPSGGRRTVELGYVGTPPGE